AAHCPSRRAARPAATPRGFPTHGSESASHLEQGSCLQPTPRWSASTAQLRSPPWLASSRVDERQPTPVPGWLARDGRCTHHGPITARIETRCHRPLPPRLHAVLPKHVQPVPPLTPRSLVFGTAGLRGPVGREPALRHPGVLSPRR